MLRERVCNESEEEVGKVRDGVKRSGGKCLRRYLSEVCHNGHHFHILSAKKAVCSMNPGYLVHGYEYESHVSLVTRVKVC